MSSLSELSLLEQQNGPAVYNTIQYKTKEQYLSLQRPRSRWFDPCHSQTEVSHSLYAAVDKRMCLNDSFEIFNFKLPTLQDEITCDTEKK